IRSTSGPGAPGARGGAGSRGDGTRIGARHGQRGRRPQGQHGTDNPTRGRRAMKHDRRSIVTAVAVIAALSLGACADAAAEEEEGSREATVEEIDGSEVSRVTLTEDAVRRLDVQTEEITAVDGGQGTQIA